MAHGRMKYYVINKEADYRRGFWQQMSYRDNGLWNRIGADGMCLFISGLYDGRETGCVWHRMILLGLEAVTVPMTLKFYASDEPYIFDGEKPTAIEDLIGLPETEMDTERKLQLFEPYIKLETAAANSLLLHDISGRYMWFVMSAYCPAEETAGFGGGTIYFPKATWLDYLPEIYSQGIEENPFFERYLAIFQTLYDELGRKIDMFPELLDAASTDIGQLKWLAGWLGIGCIHLWNEAQLRYLIANAHRLYRMRGTKEGICEFIKLYTGEEPLVAEQHQIEHYIRDNQQYALLRSLYGDDPKVFTVLIRASLLPTGKEFFDLQKIIGHICPAWMNFKLVTLRPYILLDSYSYLGVNSSLGQYRPAELDGLSMLSFTKVGDTGQYQ